MSPNLSPDWKAILRKAWSVRWIIAAAVLSALEVALPVLREMLEPLGLLPPGIFAVAAAFASGGAIIARVMVQPPSTAPPAAPPIEPR